MMRAGRPPAYARVLAGALLAAASLLAIAVARPSPAAAAPQTNLSYTSASTWTADPTEARVHVSAALTVTSHAPSTGSVPYFYDYLELTLPPSATGTAAVSLAGDPLTVAVAGQSSSGQVVDVAFGQRLYAGQTERLELTFDLVDSGGSTDRDLRIGRNLMSFPVSAFGSPNTPGSSVTVIFPADLTVQEEFGSLTRSVFGSGEEIFTSGMLDDATTLSAWFTATQPVPPQDFLTRGFTLGPLNVSLRYWADDPGWAIQVEHVLQAGYPLLRDAIGLGDPAGTSLTVTEASSEEIGGFAGAYEQANGQVQVSYFADPFVILHEAAHMWFNAALASDRWIVEGFASYYAEQAVLKLGYPDHAPLLSSRLLQAAVPFSDWVSAGVPSSATDAYLYGATLEAAREIESIAGPTGLQAVWQAAEGGIAAYQAADARPVETQGGPIDWQRFLDLLEQKTGRSYVSIWSRWVVSVGQAPLLTERASAREAYATLVAQAGTWSLPPEIRVDLDDWQFDRATLAMNQTRTILAQRAQIASAAAQAGTTTPPTLQASFETAPIATTAAEAAGELSALQTIADAQRAQAQSNGGGFLIGSDPAADLAAAREAFARGDLSAARSFALNASSAWRGGLTAQAVRVVGSILGTLGLLMLLGVYIWTRRWRLADRAAQSAEGAAAVDAAPQAAPVGAAPAGAARRSGRVPAAARHSLAGGSVGRAASTGGPAEAVDAGEDALDDLGFWLVPVLANAADDAAEEPDEASGDRGGVSESGPRGSDGSSDADGRGDDPADGVADAGDSILSAFGSEGGLPEGEESAYELLQRGKALLRDRHNAQAAVVLERAARVEPGKGSILEALGRAYFNSGQHVRAAETFGALLEIDPSAHYGHFALGLSFARLGRDHEARKHLRLAVALHPSSETYRRALEKMEASTP